MFKFITDWFGKKPHPNAEAPAVKPETAPYKVEVPVQVAPTVVPEPVTPAPAAPKAPAKKRTFVKREEGGVAKVAPVKAKPKAPAKPRTPRAK